MVLDKVCEAIPTTLSSASMLADFVRLLLSEHAIGMSGGISKALAVRDGAKLLSTVA